MDEDEEEEMEKGREGVFCRLIGHCLRCGGPDRRTLRV